VIPVNLILIINIVHGVEVVDNWIIDLDLDLFNYNNEAERTRYCRD